jgi:proton-translocating NADH-quinone oxidoreductase chain M
MIFYIPILKYYNINYIIGIDNISLFFLNLTTFLILICFLNSWYNISKNVKEFFIYFFFLEFLLINVFLILDLFFFFIFFESILIPIFLIIGIWGTRENKIKAAFKFFFYTFFGSLFLLIAILIIYAEIGSTDFRILNLIKINEKKQYFLWFCFFLTFAIKIPMIPFHTWLPETHAEAPTAGSIILAGVLLKLGTYGFLRFLLTLFPEASIFFTPLINILSILAIIYISLTTIRQIDLKKMIAYSSISHMGYITLGLFTKTIQGIEGSIFLMISHGIVSSALFICIGILYDRYHTRIINYYNGLVYTMPIFSIYFFFFILANMSIPLTCNFIGEFLILIGIFQKNIIISILATFGILFTTSYNIWLYNRIIYGKFSFNFFKNFYDLSKREFYILFLFFILILILGLFPNIILNYLHYNISYLILTKYEY